MTRRKRDKITIDLTPPTQLRRSTDQLVRGLDAVSVVDSPDTYELAVEWLRAARTQERRWADFFKSLREPLTQALDALRAREADVLREPRRLMAVVSASIVTYRDAAAERKRAAEAAARAEAEAQAAAVREAQLAALQQAARAAESKAAAAALRKTAKALVAAPVIPVPAPPVPSDVPAVKGLYARETWQAEVEDFKALVIAAALPLLLELPKREQDQAVIGGLVDVYGTAPLACLRADQSALNKLAVAAGETLAIPGVKPVRRSTIVVRSDGN